MKKLALGFVALMALSGGAQAQSVVGNWTRDDGLRSVNITRCGEFFCGAISAVKDPNDKAKVGQRVFSNIKEVSPGKFTGTAIDPDDGKQYTGSFTLSGNTLSAGGCVMGGMVCRTRNYRRG